MSERISSVKLQYQREIRRFPSHYLDPLEDFESVLNKVGVELGVTTQFTLDYVDEEEDTVTVRSQVEWEEALKLHMDGGWIPKFYVNDGCQYLEDESIAEEAGARVEPEPLNVGLAERTDPTYDLTRVVDTRSTSPDTPAAPQAPERGPEEAQNIACELMAAEKYEEAFAILERCAESHPNYATTFYNLACNHSLIGEKPEAIQNLKKCCEIGWNPSDYTVFANDPDLDNLRTSTEFGEWMVGFVPASVIGNYFIHCLSSPHPRWGAVVLTAMLKRPDAIDQMTPAQVVAGASCAAVAGELQDSIVALKRVFRVCGATPPLIEVMDSVAPYLGGLAEFEEFKRQVIPGEQLSEESHTSQKDEETDFSDSSTDTECVEITPFEYAEELERIKELGLFDDEDLLRAVLLEHKGDVQAAVAALCVTPRG